GPFEEWQAQQADELRRALADALARLSTKKAAAGDTAAALAHARRWVTLDPYAENAHRELMRLLAQTGDRTAALRQFAELARVLDRDLGVAPLPETRALRDAIRDGAELTPPSAARVVGIDEAIGDLHTLHGQYAKAIASYESAAAAAAGPARAAIEHKLASVHHRRGNWDDAERHYRAALADPDPGHQARVHADWTLAAHRRGDAIRARTLAEQALVLARRARDDRALAQVHNILGILTADASHLERSLDIAERLGDVSARIAALNNLALARSRSGDVPRAIELTGMALEASAELGDRHREAALHNNMADLLRAAGRREDAMRHLKRAVAIFSEIGDPGGMEPEVWKLVQW
ncbi:MAG: BTAD domain-containing putative transcriptional regulator, partial [Candidatus Limnocylindria bacterium]